MKCPNCGSAEIGEMITREEVPEQLELNKCHECNCIFLIIIFQEGVPAK